MKHSTIIKIITLIVINQAFLISFGQTYTSRFLTDLGTWDYAHSLAIQDDGKVIVAGDTDGKPCMIRYDTDGLLDNTFGAGGKVFATWECAWNPADIDIKLQKDGKIVIGTRYYNGIDADFIVARYNSDGNPDISFGNNGHVITQIGSYSEWCHSIAIQSDGKILAGGLVSYGPTYNYNCDFAIVRYNSNGTLDNTFGNNGKVTTNIGLHNNTAYSIAIQQNGKIILAGEANDYDFSDFAVVRYNSDGTLDSTFGGTGIVRTSICDTYDRAKSIVLQLDGKIIVAGHSQNGLYNFNFALVRYNTDGSLDNSFGINGFAITDFESDIGNSVALQTDGKIILAGGSTAIGTTLYNFATLRYNTDGTLDNSFGINGMITTSFDGESEGEAVILGNDGEILIAGSTGYDIALIRLFSKLSVGVIDIDDNTENLSLFPNPIQRDFEITYSLNKSQNVTITLLNMQGEIVQVLLNNQLKQSGSHSEFYSLNNNIPSGQYLMTISSKDNTKTVKIIKQ